jgi:hypothetical protein
VTDAAGLLALLRCAAISIKPARQRTPARHALAFLTPLLTSARGRSAGWPGPTDAYQVLGKTFGPGSVFSARLEEHRRLLGKTFGPNSVLAGRLEGHRRLLGKTFGPNSVLAGRREEHRRLLGKTFGPGSVFSARLEEHRDSSA